jgi:hypothetical protein
LQKKNIQNVGKRHEWCIKREDFRKAYNAWIIEMKYPIDKSSSSVFTKHMSLLGIKNFESHSILWYENIKFGEYNEE